MALNADQARAVAVRDGLCVVIAPVPAPARPKPWRRKRQP
jgi:hypothetical protein